MHCTKCGAANDAGASFCETCGQQMNQPGAAPIVTQPGTVQPAFSPSRKVKPVYLIVAAVVVLALVLGAIYKFKGSDSNPEAVVVNFLQAVETQNQIAGLDCIVPYERDILADYAKRVMELAEEESPYDIVSTENALENVEFDFENMKYKTEINGDQAKVTVTSGDVTVESVGRGDRERIDIPDDLEDERPPVPDLTVVLVKDSGEWRISVARTLSEFLLEMGEREVRRGSRY